MNFISNTYALGNILGPGYLKYGFSAGEYRPKSTQPDLSGIRVAVDGSVLSLDATDGAQQAETLQISTAIDAAARSTIETTYSVHGATFTERELETAQDLLESTAGILHEGSLGVNYDDYARMGLGEQTIRKTAEDFGFQEEQIQAILEDYREQVQQHILSSLRFVDYQNHTEYRPHGKYYLLQEQNGVLSTYPEIAVDFDRAAQIYSSFASGSYADAKSQFNALANEALSSLSTAQGWNTKKLARFNAQLDVLYEQFSDFQSRFLTGHPRLDVYG